jgi:hypothetical protein
LASLTNDYVFNEKENISQNLHISLIHDPSIYGALQRRKDKILTIECRPSQSQTQHQQANEQDVREVLLLTPPALS